MYKEKEFDLRNNIQFENIDFTNFIKFSDNLIIDFENIDGKFKNILINIKDQNEVLIYAKDGEIIQTNDKISFSLVNGFKTEIKKNVKENLKFETYLAEFSIDEKKIYKKSDPNALDIFELLINKENNKIFLLLRLIDTLIIISLSIYFYLNIIKTNKFNISNQMIFIIISILCLSMDNLLENFIFANNVYIFLLFINILFIHIVPKTINYLIELK